MEQESDFNARDAMRPSDAPQCGDGRCDGSIAQCVECVS
jgi:hypothetical protein